MKFLIHRSNHCTPTVMLSYAVAYNSRLTFVCRTIFFEILIKHSRKLFKSHNDFFLVQHSHTFNAFELDCILKEKNKTIHSCLPSHVIKAISKLQIHNNRNATHAHTKQIVQNSSTIQFPLIPPLLRSHLHAQFFFCLVCWFWLWLSAFAFLLHD